jgi:hypothetical protein
MAVGSGVRSGDATTDFRGAGVCWGSGELRVGVAADGVDEDAELAAVWSFANRLRRIWSATRT